MKLLFALLLGLLYPHLIFSTPFQTLKEKGLDNYWLKLGHYQENFFGGYTSRVDSPEFFFHEDGKDNPEKELNATIRAFESNDSIAGFLKLPPQCVFVERYRFLTSVGLVNSNKIPCPDFEEWKKGINAESVVLIFSSSFPNNPASMFGHTFIRFKQKNQSDLLDYTASFAAVTEGETEGVIYALKGLFGGYKGAFSISPYYIKVNEYSNSESRDLYEYELNLPAEGVERIIHHLWELYSSSYFDYFFIDENCSYILSTLVEIGNPDWNLTRNGNWYYLPSDSIALLAEIPGAVKKIEYRPSLKQKLINSLSLLNSKELEQYEMVLNGKTAIKTVTNISVLDTLIVYWNYRKMEEKDDFSDHSQENLRNTLIHRSTIHKKSLEVDLSDKIDNRPELSHSPSMIAFGIGSYDGESVLNLHYKSGLQDLLANDRGMEPYSQIDFLSASLSYCNESKKFSLSDINWINVTSLQPYTSFDPRVSWRVGINTDTLKDIDCDNCLKHDIDLGFGGSLYLGTPQLVFYALGGGYSEFSKHLEGNRRSGPFLEWSVIGMIGDIYKFQIKQILRADALQDVKKNTYLQSGISQALYLHRNLELRLISYTVSNSQTTGPPPFYNELRLVHYF